MRSVTDEELRAAAMGTALTEPGVAPPTPPTLDETRKRAERVYFVRMHVEDGPIKIGLSWNTYARFMNFLVASPYELTYLGDMRGDGEVEHEIHARFAHLRMRGEWFHPAPELLDFIAANVVQGAQQH